MCDDERPAKRVRFNPSGLLDVHDHVRAVAGFMTLRGLALLSRTSKRMRQWCGDRSLREKVLRGSALNLVMRRLRLLVATDAKFEQLLVMMRTYALMVAGSFMLQAIFECQWMHTDVDIWMAVDELPENVLGRWRAKHIVQLLRGALDSVESFGCHLHYHWDHGHLNSMHDVLLAYREAADSLQFIEILLHPPAVYEAQNFDSLHHFMRETSDFRFCCVSFQWNKTDERFDVYFAYIESVLTRSSEYEETTESRLRTYTERGFDLRAAKKKPSPPPSSAL